MANIKISAMTAATSVTATDQLAAVVSTDSKSVTLEQVLMTKSLSDTRWDDIRVPVTSTKKAGSNDPHFAKIADNGSGSQGVFAELFDKTTEEELYFQVQMPHSWKIGTDIVAHVHWCPVDTDTGTIQWGLEYSMAEIDAVIGDSTLALSTATAAPGTAYQHTLLDIVTIDMSAVTSLSSIISCRVYRNVAGDTYNEDAALLEIDFHYEVDSLGSSTEFVK